MRHLCGSLASLCCSLFSCGARFSPLHVTVSSMAHAPPLCPLPVLYICRSTASAWTRRGCGLRRRSGGNGTSSCSAPWRCSYTPAPATTPTAPATAARRWVEAAWGGNGEGGEGLGRSTGRLGLQRCACASALHPLALACQPRLLLTLASPFLARYICLHDSSTSSTRAVARTPSPRPLALAPRAAIAPLPCSLLGAPAVPALARCQAPAITHLPAPTACAAIPPHTPPPPSP